VKARLTTTVTRYVLAFAALAAAAVIYKYLLKVNPTTVALTFLLLVLVTAAYWSFRIALVLAIAATATFNFFFLPPYGTFTIADPQNWIALLAFLISALIASNLAERARLQAEQSNRRRRELERLYAFSQSMLVNENVVELLNRVPGKLADSFGAGGAALMLDSKDTIYRSDPAMSVDAGTLKATIARGEPTVSDNTSFVPLRTGVRSTGAIAIRDATLSPETLDAIGSLVGLTLERVRAVEEVTKARAQQESERLRSALLDSVTHEFRTPLTSIKASVTTLLSSSDIGHDERLDLLNVINEESDRLNRLVGEAAEMARLDAGMFTLEKRPTHMQEVIDSAIQERHLALQSHQIDVRVPDELPMVQLDFEKIREVLMHLLENAAKYSIAGTPIVISAAQEKKAIAISVADQGPGIDAFEQMLIFDKFYRGRNQLSAGGTGMGLAICKVIVEAHGGTIRVVSQIGKGSVFTFTVPV
jgi:two-component system sensor histidine kinase KdpD